MPKKILIFILMVIVLSYSINAKAKTNKIILKKLNNSHFQLIVDSKPFIIKGICYNPAPIGKGPDYDLFVDKTEPWRADGKLIQDIGVNTIFIFNPSSKPQRTYYVIENLFKLYGIRTILGFKLGLKEFPPVNYSDPLDKERLTKEVISAVRFLKNNHGILFWVLGNENNYTFSSKEQARVYYGFVNDLAKQVKKTDKLHPVALGNAETVYLEEAKPLCPDIDLLGCISYRGKSFGSLWQEIDRKFGKPVILLEFGCDSYNALTKMEDQNNQVEFIKSQWQDIIRNTANNNGKGNALGGCVFEWTDEWWKSDETSQLSWLVHDTKASWSGGGYYFDLPAPEHLNMNEEWWGILSITSEIEDGINKRTPKKAYYMLKDLWAK